MSFITKIISRLRALGKSGGRYLPIFTLISISTLIFLLFVPLIPQSYERGEMSAPQFFVSEPSAYHTYEVTPYFYDDICSHLTSTKLVMASYGRNHIRYIYRELIRNNEPVTVIYFNISQSVVNIIFDFGWNIFDWNRNWRMYDVVVREANDKQRTVEVYFLPTNLRRIYGLCDAGFDAERANGVNVLNKLV